MKKDITIKLGDYEVIALDRENSMNPMAKVHMAFVRYNGMIPATSSPVLVFEIGKYDGDKDVQSGNPHYLPVIEKMLDYRVDTHGRRVKLEITHASPLEIKADDLTERQTAISD